MRALLISSGLLQFFLKEARKHVEWVKERSPHRALDGKTPYEMKYKKKPHLAGIHEFGAVAYVKDLKARKLDSCTQLGRFVGYDSESKGFRIYWPTKRSVTIKQNVVFHDGDVTVDDTAVIPGNSSEGEKEKIIQNPENTIKCTEDDPIKNTSSEPHLENNTNLSLDPEAQNTVPFPSTPETSDAISQDPIEDEPDEEPGLGCG